jgi:diguanylate cyclase (GGDEF)-like protein/PAS domain S-box-containing protein
MNSTKRFVCAAMPAFKDPEVYRDILDALQIGVSVVDLQRTIVFWSDGAEQITGYARIDVLGHPYTDNILQHCNQSVCETCAENCPLATALHDARTVETIGFIHHKSGYRAQVHMWAIPLRDQHGLIIGVIQTFEGEFAVTAPDLDKPSMQRHGWLDEVTGLPNRVMMQSHLRETLAAYSEFHIPFGIICLEANDLAQFRARYGQGAARSILQVLARTLRNTVWPTDVVGAWSDSQFMAILMGCREDALHSVSTRVLRMLSNATITWWGEQLSAALSTSCTAVRPGDTVEAMLERLHAGFEGSMGTEANAASAKSSAS